MNKPTLTLERTMNAPAERIYKAFLDPAMLAKFQAPPGTEIIFHGFKAEIGAEHEYVMGNGEHSSKFRVKYLELDEFTKIRHTYHMEMPGLPDTPMEIQISFEPQNGATLVRFEQWGLPEPIPVEGATQGWTFMLKQLQALVEATTVPS